MGVCRLETAELALVTAAFVLEAAVPVVGAAAAAAGGPGAGPGTAKAGHHLYGPWSCRGRCKNEAFVSKTMVTACLNHKAVGAGVRMRHSSAKHWSPPQNNGHHPVQTQGCRGRCDNEAFVSTTMVTTCLTHKAAGAGATMKHASHASAQKGGLGTTKHAA
eukprot:1158430-Pelagomonas_calceolata.AAC.4